MLHPLILQGFGGVAPNVCFATTYIHSILQQPTFCLCKKHNHVSWYTSDSDICEIYDNTVYAYAPGKATIKARVHGKTYTCKVVVNKPVIKNFSLSDSKLQLYSDEQELQYIFVENVDEDYFSYYNVSAVSSNSDVVEVYDIADGEISFVVNGIGEADISVSFGGKQKICHVVVLAAEETEY